MKLSRKILLDKLGPGTVDPRACRSLIKCYGFAITRDINSFFFNSKKTCAEGESLCKSGISCRKHVRFLAATMKITDKIQFRNLTDMIKVRDQFQN